MSDEINKKTAETAKTLFGKGIKMDPPLSDVERIQQRPGQ